MTININELEKAIRESWGPDTTYPECFDEWEPHTPSLGQCAVTALVVQDYFGGNILYCKHNHHYWNKTDDETIIDFTKDQFPYGTELCMDSIQTRHYLLEHERSKKVNTPERYQLLKYLVAQKIGGP